MTSRILLIENPGHVVHPFGKLLSAAFQVDIVETAAVAAMSPAPSCYAAVLLNGGAASISELVSVIHELRAVGLPSVLVLSGEGIGVNFTKLLEAGAWDCLPAVVVGPELIARTKSLIRWSRNHDFAGHDTGRGQWGEVVIGDMCITPSKQRVTVGGRDLNVSQREFDLLLTLARRPGEVITRHALMESLWGAQRAREKRTTTVNVYLNRLRSRLGETVSHPRYLHTVYGAGVKLEAPRIP